MTIPIDADVVHDARKLRPAAVNAILQANAPCVYRLAYALAGRWDVGRGVARFVLNRSIRLMPKWKPEDDPANWYHRYTIMVSRRGARHTIVSPAKDVLVEQAVNTDTRYIAFVSALRQLDTQQREAFLLNHCERLNARYSALAMDCSTEAADNHLRAADQALRLVAGEDFDALAKMMCDAYAHLTPDPNDLLPTVNSMVFRGVRLRKWLRRVVLLIALAAFAALLWGGWIVYHRVAS
jgi:DNA-directed RNA polymerase specialized sigma24 family protein